MESDCDHPSEMEARLDDRWLRPEEICEVLQNPNSTFTEMPAIMPPSGSIYLFNKKKQKGFRNDHYTWKKAKKGRFKEGHEKLKFKGVDALHCYYAHREDDENFQRRIYWSIDENLKHIVLVHYRDVKEDQIRTGRGVLPSRETDASAYNHQASSGLPPVPGSQHEIASSSIPNPSNFQHSQDPRFWESVGNLLTDPSYLYEINNLFDVFPAGPSSSAAVELSHSSLGKRQCGEDEEEEGNDTNQARKRLKVTCGQKNHEQELEPTSIEPENGKSKAVVQNDFGMGKSHEFSKVESLHELLDRVSAPNTLACSTISSPTIDSQAIAKIRTTLEMDFTTVAGDVQLTDKISLIKSFIYSDCFPTGSRTMILPILKQLKQPLLDYSEYDKGKNLNDQVEARIKRLQPKIQFWEEKKIEFKKLEEWKMQIEANQAAIRAEIDGAVKEIEPIQAELEELIPQRDQFKEIEGNLKTSLDIGDGFWRTLKKVLHRLLPM